MSLVIVVEFRLAEDAWNSFLPLIKENAATSMRLEPGCLRFDVATSQQDALVFLYEIYDDAAAFDAHLEEEHYLTFDAATKPMVESKTVKRLHLEPARSGFPPERDTASTWRTRQKLMARKGPQG